MFSTPIIVWDVDDVLNCLMKSWLQYWSQESGLKIILNEIIKNPPQDILGITKEDYLNSLDTFRNSDLGKDLEVNHIIKKWFLHHGNKFNHIACTGRPIRTMPNQAWWLYKNYSQWIKTVHMTGADRDLESRKISKADFISFINSDVVFIDDCENNINSVSKIGGITLLYPQPWNKANYTEVEFISKLNSLLGL